MLVQKSHIMKAVRTLGRFAAAGNGNLMLQSDGSTLTIQAANQSTTMTAKIEARGELIKTVIPAREFIRAVDRAAIRPRGRYSPDKTVEIYRAHRDYLVVVGESNETTIKRGPTRSWPVGLPDAGPDKCSLNAGLLAYALNAANRNVMSDPDGNGFIPVEAVEAVREAFEAFEPEEVLWAAKERVGRFSMPIPGGLMEVQTNV